MCIRCVSGYGLGENRGRVVYEYTGNVGYATLRPDLPKS